MKKGKALMLTVLILLQIKHWYVDFISQTADQIKFKGVYGNLTGLEHSFWHGVLTTVIVCFFVNPFMALFIGLVDLVLHYHIDYAKMRYGCKDPSDKKYWRDFGLDQLAHQLTYILIVIMIGIYGTTLNG